MTEESAIQKAVFDELKARAMPGVVAWHVPNDKASTRKAGFMRGVHDVHVLHKGKFYSLELKVPKGEVSIEQLRFRDRIEDAGGYSFIAYGREAAFNALVGWGLLRPEARA